MGADRVGATDRATLGRAVIDLIGASSVLAAIVGGAVCAVTLVFGGGAVEVKQGLFVVGLLMAGAGTVLLRSSTPDDRVDRTGPSVTDTHRESRLRPLLERILPDALVVPPEARFSDASKLAGGGVVVLSVSYLLETAFAVGV